MEEAGERGKGEVEILRRTTQSLTLRARTDRKGWLVISQAHDPSGWRAFVDGREVPLHRADVMLSALSLEAGEHVILLRYLPWTFLWGLALSAGVAGMLVWWIRPGSSS
ncbi:MAG: hypothetical protein D6819_06805 [Gammaproteobacteria bacterium]|nr:MAG: hypothetical protein D6819_06805 [Gammaproteobacteria bacterium]